MANQIDFILRNGLQVTNNVVVGSYTMVNTAPINGMIVSGSVGIGTVDPTQKLHVVGNLQLTNSAGFISGIYFPDGTYQNTSATSYATPAAGPANSIQYNTGSGFGGSPLLTFHNGNSHVGIGTSEARYILDVQATDGPAKFATLNGSDYQIWVGNNTPVGNTAVFGFSSANQYAYITTGNNQPTPILVATQGNNVGIGITNPANKLDINGSVAAGTYAGTAAPVNGFIVSGTVGIGVTNPTSKLAVLAGAGVVGAVIQANATPGDFIQLQDSNGATKFNVNSSGNVATGGWAGNAIMANYGGTGLTSYTTGDILYASSSSTTLNKLTIGSTGNVLVVSGGAPFWGNVSLSGGSVGGILPISKGGTNVTSFSGSAVVVTSANGLVMSSVTSTTNAAVVFDNSGVPTSVTGGPYTYLTPNAGGGALTFAKVDVANGVTGTLALVNGGTGIPSVAQYSILYGSGNAVSYSTLVSAATSALVTSNTNAPQWTSGTVANRVLRTDGTTITFSQVALATDVSGVLPLANGGTNAALTPTNGGIVYGTSSGLAISSTAALFFNNSSGFFGINTNNPSAYLDINGNAIIRNGGNIVAGGLYVQAGVGNFVSSVIASSLTSNSFVNGASLYSSGPISAVGSITAATFTANTSVYSPYINATTSANVNGITSNTTVIVNGTVDSISQTTGALTVAGGVGIAKTLWVGNAAFVQGNLTVGGNLIVSGNITYLNTNVTVMEDPVIAIGTGPNGSNLVVADTYDRGLEFHYYSGADDRYGFIGWQNATGRLTYIANATGNLTSQVYTGPFGDAQFGNIIVSGALNTPIPSTTTGTGALIIGGTGGIGVGGNINAGGNIYTAQGFNSAGTSTVNYLVSNTGISSSTISASGAITGASLTSNSFVSGTSLYSSGPISAVGNASFANLISNGFVQGTSVYSSGPISAAGNGTFANLTSNGFITAASISVAGGFSAPGQITGGSIVSNSSVTANTITSNSTITTIALSATGTTTLSSANSTTSATSGALIVTGGIATAANLYVAGASWINNLSIISSNTSTSATTGALVVRGGVGIGGNVYSASSGWIGNLSVTNSTAASSTTTGAVIVAGGVGIGGALYVGGLLSGAAINGTSLYSSGPISAVGNASFANVISNGFVNGTSVYSSGPISAVGTITGAVLTANTSISSGGTVSAPGTITGGSLVSNSTITGNAITSNSSISTVSFTATGNSVFNSGNNSTSATTGAVQISGGVGIVGNLYTATSAWHGNLSITNATASTNNTTGALVVAGGAGIAGSIFVGGTITGRSIDATAVGNISPSTGQFTSAIVQNGLTAGSVISNSFVNGTSLYSSGPISAVGNGTFANVISNAAIIGATVQGSTSMLTGTFVANTSVTTTNMLASGTATVQTLVSNTSVNGNTFILNGNVATTATTGALVLDSFATATYRTAHYIVQVTDNTNLQYHATQIMLIHNGTNVYQSEYNIIYSNGVLGTFDSVISAGTVQLQFTASAATNKTIKVLRTAVIT